MLFDGPGHRCFRSLPDPFIELDVLRREISAAQDDLLEALPGGVPDAAKLRNECHAIVEPSAHQTRDAFQGDPPGAPDELALAQTVHYHLLFLRHNSDTTLRIVTHRFSPGLPGMISINGSSDLNRRDAELL